MSQKSLVERLAYRSGFIRNQWFRRADAELLKEAADEIIALQQALRLARQAHAADRQYAALLFSRMRAEADKLFTHFAPSPKEEAH